MQWAARKQLIYAGVVILVIAVLAAAGWFVFFYRAPSCTDGIKNQNEGGIDCDGTCTKLCTAPRVSYLWARSVEVAPGVYHAVAMVKNPETGAGTESLPYKFSLYDADNILVAERSGVMALDPGEVIPLLETNIVTGNRAPAKTLLSFGTALWNRAEPAVNPVIVSAGKVDAEALSLSASLENPTIMSIPKVTLTALVYGEGDTLIAASQTVVTDLAAETKKTVTFTWQEPFSEPPLRAVVTARLR